MADWLTYKGQYPWLCDPVVDKVEYNEGSSITKSPRVSGGSPIWKVNQSGPAITPTHIPCGYWFKDSTPPGPIVLPVAECASYGWLGWELSHSSRFTESNMAPAFNPAFNNAPGLIDGNLCYNWAYYADIGQQWVIFLILGIKFEAVSSLSKLRVYTLQYGGGQWDTPHEEHAMFKVWISNDRSYWELALTACPPGRIIYTGLCYAGLGCYYDIIFEPKLITKYVALSIASSISAGGYGQDIAYEIVPY